MEEFFLVASCTKRQADLKARKLFSERSSSHLMKTKIQILSLITLAGAFVMTGCAGPEVRHDVRVDRRTDSAERVEDRSGTRQYNRNDRQGDRYDRRGTRYGY
jgi:hypothetical protein